jgi:hypothetical protein
MVNEERWFIETWLSYSGCYYREDPHTYPTEQAAEDKVDSLIRWFGWQTPAPCYRVTKENRG